MDSAAKTSGRFNWREFWLLWGAGVASAVAVLPYALTLLPTMARKPLPFSLPVLVLLSVAQSSVVLALAVGLGLLAARAVGLGAPLVEAWLGGERVDERLRAILAPSVLVGVGVGAVILALEFGVFGPRLPAVAHLAKAQNPPAWMGFLASFHGGIGEELLMRLGLFSGLVWVFLRLGRSPSPPGAALLWAANVISALLFGLGHLPATAQLAPLTPLIMARALVLNGVAGIAFGWLYYRRGLESAMLAHFSADILLHVLAVMTFGGG